jgi:hypothetical protein
MKIENGNVPSDEQLMSDEMGAAFCTGFSPNGRVSHVPRDEWPAEIERMHKEEIEWWNTAKLVDSHLIVELPFWMMVPKGTLQVSVGATTLPVTIYGDFVEVYHGPAFLNSHANVAFVGPFAELEQKDIGDIVSNKSPIYRCMRTVLIFPTMAVDDAFLALNDRHSIGADDRPQIRRVNRALQYFDSLAFGHIPFVNKLITSYRSTSLDPCAFETSEWDIPIWYAQSEHHLARINLMPYWDNDKFPHVNSTSGAEPYFAATHEQLTSQLGSPVSPGKMELLDALSLSYRGRYADAVRSAVTAIEVALESELRRELANTGLSVDAIDARLAETRNTFFDRLEAYQQISKRRLPGPIISVIPYINGLRFRSELENVRSLRHKLVHEGTRIDIFARGSMLRAVETMTWLFSWLSRTDEHGPDNHRNYSFFTMMRGQRKYDFEYGPTGVVVKRDQSMDTPESIPTVEQLRTSQYTRAITPPNCDIELFARMTFMYVGLSCEEAPPDVAKSPIFHRFVIRDGQRKAIVFCLEADGSIDVTTANQVATASLAFQRSREEYDWNTLCIVQHQRHLAISLRQIQDAIPSDVEAIAIACGITFITTNDILLVVRGLGEYGWDLSNTKNAFFSPGRQLVTPPSYRAIGRLNQFYPKPSVMSVDIYAGASVKVGETVGIRLSNRYFEEVINSVEHKRAAVSEALGPQRVGIRTSLQKNDFKGSWGDFRSNPISTNHGTGR